METFEERQERENKEHYQKWLSCGFKGEMEVDEYGWCRLGNSLKGEEVAVFDKGYQNRATLYYVQLPNQKWISGFNVFCRTQGCCNGLSIWNRQYNTKEEAIEKALYTIERYINEKDKKLLIKKVEEIRNRFKQDTLFMPIMAEQFEQVALF